MSPFINHVEHVTNVYTDASCQSFVEVDVATEAVPVAVKSQSDELTFAVEDRRTGVSARDIVVGEEAKLQLSGRFISVWAERSGIHQAMHHGLCLVIKHAVVAPFHLFDEAFCRGVIGRMAAEGDSFHLSVGQTHREIGVTIVGHVFFHAQFCGAKQAFLLVDAVACGI